MKVQAILGAAALLAAAGCGNDGPSEQGNFASPPAAAASKGAVHRPPEPASTRRSKSPLRRAHCPAGASNCRSAEGTIVYVERVDPDGDGDAHFVLLSDQGVTSPGLSVIDVERGLRPHPLPEVGDRVSAAGPVYRGSFGQRQIQATEVFAAPGGPDSSGR